MTESISVHYLESNVERIARGMTVGDHEQLCRCGRAVIDGSWWTANRDEVTCLTCNNYLKKDAKRYG